VKILRDLTERRKLEEDLREETAIAQQERERAETSARKVEQLNALLRRAMSEAHHRIKNSFQMLSALVDMQQESQEEGASMDYANSRCTYPHCRQFMTCLPRTPELALNSIM